MELQNKKTGLRIFIHLTSALLSDALQQLLKVHPDALHLETATGRYTGESFIPEIILVDAGTLVTNITARWPLAKVLLLDTGLEEEKIIQLLINHRIDGVIAVDTDADLFRKAIHAVGSGQVWIDNGKLKALMSHVETLARNQRHDSISSKEREIIVLVSQGMRNREIAEKLRISEQTVKAHLGRIFRKTNVTSRAQLVPLAFKLRS